MAEKKLGKRVRAKSVNPKMRKKAQVVDTVSEARQPISESKFSDITSGIDFSGRVSDIIKSKVRFISIDYLRSIVVLLMIFTHVVAIFLNLNEPGGKLAEYVSLIGGTICFSTFLILSGASSYFSILKYDHRVDSIVLEHKKQKTILRALQILLLYYFLALFSVYTFKIGFIGDPSFEWVRDFFRVLFFQAVPPFTEFLIPLFVFIFFSGVFHKFYYHLYRNKLLVIISLPIIYTIGHFLYRIDLGDLRLNLVKSIFVGHSDLHTFPLVQYYPLFLLGILLGKIYTEEEINRRIKKLLLISLVSFIIYIGSMVIYKSISDLAFFNPSIYTGRFPPSMAFLSLTIGIAIVSLIIFDLISISTYKRFLDIQTFLNSISTNLSKSALSYFFFHTVILFGLKIYFENINESKYQVKDSISIVLIYSAVVISCFLLKYIWEWIDIYLIEQIPLEIKINIINIIFLVLGAFTIYFGIVRNIEFSKMNKTSIGSKVQRVFKTQEKEIWWNYEYQQRTKLSIDGTKITNQNNWVYLNVNHKDLFERGVSKLSDAKDIRIIQKYNGEFSEIATFVSDSNTDMTKISFKVLEDRNAEYYMYVGNQFAEEKIAIDDTNGIDTAETIQMTTLELHELDLKTPRRWYLKGYTNPEAFNIEVKPDSLTDIHNIIKADYEVIGTNVFGTLTYNEETNSFNASPDIASLEPGNYKIRTSVIELGDSLEILLSDEERIFVSYPLFVNWSLDWEGFGINDFDLKDIEEIASKYRVKITHFFNPRIYVKDQFSTFTVSEQLANHYTFWIMARKNQLGEEIGLHLHLYPDLLKEVGVEKRPEGQIIGINRDETALSAYTTEELSKIIEWSLNKFYEKGISRPKSFRSGAWMSSPDLQEALVEWEFDYDSSGRSGGVLNPAQAGSTPIPWNLSSTTKPYMPNLYNLNSASTPTFGIWQFPNNGADSFWFTKEELISRFNQNFKIIMDSPQTVTYLSHPHSFKQFDSTKIRGLFDYIESYRSDKDMGPVVVTTLENIYNNYNMELFYK